MYIYIYVYIYIYIHIWSRPPINVRDSGFLWQFWNFLALGAGNLSTRLPFSKRKSAAQTLQKLPCFRIYGPGIMIKRAVYFAKVGTRSRSLTRFLLCRDFYDPLENADS